MFAAGSLFCSSTMVIITRKIRHVHLSVMMMSFGLLGIIQSLAIIFIFGEGRIIVPDNVEEALLTAGVALFSFLGQTSYILGIKLEKAGPVAVVKSCDVIFSFLLQFVFLGVAPDLFRYGN